MTYSERRALAGVMLLLLASAACTDSTGPTPVASTSPSFSVVGDDGDAVGVSEFFASVNRQAVARGANVAVSRAELLLTSDAPAKTARIIFANDRQLRLQSRWVPRDIRRLATDETLSFGVYTPFAWATVGGQAESAFDATFATWNAASCSKMKVRKKALAPGQIPSFIMTSLFPPADINDVGFVPGSFFDQVFGAGASRFTVGVTITLTFIKVGPTGVPVLDPNGNPIPTDVDGDGRFDTAFKEVWFNDAMAYATNGDPTKIDIESAALHEHGHALELGHFGKIVGDPKTGKLQASPRAVMNAFILGVQRTPLGTDNAALCGNYANLK